MVYDDLLGLRYEMGARWPGTTIDCYGLVMECCGRDGRHIPDPYRSSDHPADMKQWIVERLSGWQRTSLPVPGGVVEFRGGADYPAHIGYLVTAREFLHAMEKAGVVIGRLDREPWKSRLVGYYVYEP
jgi:cell wall-associated NlpC family hydrolase